MDAPNCPPSFWFFSLARDARRAGKPAQRACPAQRRRSPQGYHHLPAFCNCTAARFALVKAQGCVSPARHPEAPKAFGILPAIS